jgi:8-oxo-dGTP pyrophosphatase MutT (NUDIX family)
VQTCKDCGVETRERIRAGWRYADGTTGPLSEPAHRENLSFDFDGVIHEHSGWRATFGRLDVAGIREAHDRGYCVTVSTCNDTWRVAAALSAAGLSVLADHKMTRGFWSGGASGKVVLVTNRKVSSAAYLDDRGINYQHGQPWAPVFDQLDALADRRHGFKSCVPGQHHHWGADGAAGLLPVATFRGRAYALLSKRGKQVQAGGTWSTLGGAVEAGEDGWAAATREAGEEVTGLGQLEPAGEHVAACPHGCGWEYRTHIVRAELTKVRVRDKWETSGLLWARLDDVPAMDLHPAFRAAWPQLSASIGAGQS